MTCRFLVFMPFQLRRFIPKDDHLTKPGYRELKVFVQVLFSTQYLYERRSRAGAHLYTMYRATMFVYSLHLHLITLHFLIWNNNWKQIVSTQKKTLKFLNFTLFGPEGQKQHWNSVKNCKLALRITQRIQSWRLQSTNLVNTRITRAWIQNLTSTCVSTSPMAGFFCGLLNMVYPLYMYCASATRKWHVIFVFPSGR